MDTKKIKSEIKKLNIPKEYFKIDLESFFSHDYTILLSIRQDAGKTTQALLLGCVLNKLYGTTTEYLRNDESQIRQKDIENLYNVVEKFGYIEKIFHEYNGVEYFPRSKKFILVKRNTEGEIINRSNKPLCVVHSNENWKNIKSSYNSPEGDYIILDEFMDTNRATFGIWSEFMNNISTIGRPDAPGRDPHVLMLGNNTDQYSFWFDDFCISDQIYNLKFGGKIESKTELGTTLCCSLLEASDIQKERLQKKKIKFFGFNTPKAAQFIGSAEWSGKAWPHIEEKPDYDNCIYRRMYIYHRNRYVQIELFQEEKKGYYLYFHFANKPLYDDNIILRLDPKEIYEIYGIGDYAPERTWKRIRKIFRLRSENRAYYSSNFVGEIVEDYIKNIK